MSYASQDEWPSCVTFRLIISTYCRTKFKAESITKCAVANNPKKPIVYEKSRCKYCSFLDCFNNDSIVVTLKIINNY